LEKSKSVLIEWAMLNVKCAMFNGWVVYEEVGYESWFLAQTEKHRE
jgi:hypothetical protein